ncbi:hypothetical protein [Candidatus Pantoea persica]|uniref:hypothetical protein n=1 Tax=Candidatus Pantoea persica TaxID=2518128 RepID=UPI00215DA8DF|nr:hypothetical protein [Candidatus Pantoea persica]MBA2815892.1 DDE transposase [Candidatus Pantoea persica]
MANSIRKLFMAIDIIYDKEKSAIGKQISTTRDELRKKKTLDSVDQRVIRPAEMNHIINEGKVNTNRFEFHIYTRVYNLLENSRIYASESEKNKRLKDDLIDAETWSKDRLNLIKNTGLARLITPIGETLSALVAKFNNAPAAPGAIRIWAQQQAGVATSPASGRTAATAAATV